MKFKFVFEKILKQKKIYEDQARRDFEEIKSKLEEQLHFMSSLEKNLKNSFNDKYTLQKTGGAVSASLSFFDSFYHLQIKLIENQKKIIKGLETILEQRRLRLVEAAKEYKMFEKLKEKKYQEFKKEVSRKELKKIDEMNTIRFGRTS